MAIGTTLPVLGFYLDPEDELRFPMHDLDSSIMNSTCHPDSFIMAFSPPQHTHFPHPNLVLFFHSIKSQWAGKKTRLLRIKRFQEIEVSKGKNSQEKLVKNQSPHGYYN